MTLSSVVDGATTAELPGKFQTASFRYLWNGSTAGQRAKSWSIGRTVRPANRPPAGPPFGQAARAAGIPPGGGWRSSHVGLPVATRAPSRRTCGRTKQDVAVSTEVETVPVEPNADVGQLCTTTRRGVLAGEVDRATHQLHRAVGRQACRPDCDRPRVQPRRRRPCPSAPRRRPGCPAAAREFGRRGRSRRGPSAAPSPGRPGCYDAAQRPVRMSVVEAPPVLARVVVAHPVAGQPACPPRERVPQGQVLAEGLEAARRVADLEDVAADEVVGQAHREALPPHAVLLGGREQRARREPHRVVPRHHTTAGVRPSDHVAVVGAPVGQGDVGLERPLRRCAEEVAVRDLLGPEADLLRRDTDHRVAGRVGRGERLLRGPDPGGSRAAAE